MMARRMATEDAARVAAPAPVLAAPAPVVGDTVDAGPGAGSAPLSSTDAAAAIRHLGELRDQNLITDEEFEAKKRELLARM
jgi:hypothetical protein